MKKTTPIPGRKLFWRTSGIALFLLGFILLLAFLGWILVQQEEIVVH